MKYKQLSEELELKLSNCLDEIKDLRQKVAEYEGRMVGHAIDELPSEEAKEILRLFAPKASNRIELVLLVRALAKLPA